MENACCLRPSVTAACHGVALGLATLPQATPTDSHSLTAEDGHEAKEGGVLLPAMLSLEASDSQWKVSTVEPRIG